MKKRKKEIDMILNIGVLLVLVIFIGYFAGVSKERRFDLPKAFVFVACETVIGITLFIAFNFFVYRTALAEVLSDFLGSLFLLILNIAIINGIILYWVIRLLVRKFNINDRVVVLSEYIIQWSLIYITIYQVIFDNLLSKEVLEEMMKLDITTPADVMTFVLPAHISSWVAVVLYRVYRKYI